MNNELIDKELELLADASYKVFNSKIVSTNYPMQGIRVPALRMLAKKLAQDEHVQAYLDDAHVNTYEHIVLYGMTLSKVKGLSLDEVFFYLDSLIPRFDNWAHVDIITSEFKIFKDNLDRVLEHFLPLKEDEGEFTKRFFIVLLLSFYMNDNYIDRLLTHLTQIAQGQYYVDMAIAWTLSVALVKYYDKTLPLLQQHRFSKFVHNKAILKARESYRILPQTKEFLNTLKIK